LWANTDGANWLPGTEHCSMEMTTCLNLFPSWVLQQPWPELAGLVVLPYVYIAYQRFHHRRKANFSVLSAKTLQT